MISTKGISKVLALLFFVLAILGGCTTAPPPSQKQTQDMTPNITPPPTGLSLAQQKRLHSAQRFLENGEYQQAESSLKKLTADAPASAQAWANLASAYYHQKNMADAAGAIKKALQLHQTSPSTYNLHGLIEMKSGRFSNAKSAFEQAIALDKTNSHAHYNLALLHDIYFQQIGHAVKYYRLYLDTIKEEDKRTASWTTQLERSLKNN